MPLAARGAWLYALLARVSTPLLPDVAAEVRGVYVACIAWREKVAGKITAAAGVGGTPRKKLKKKYGTTVAVLNLLIAVTGDYFGQGD